MFNFKAMAATHVGRYHRLKRLPSQDTYRIIVTESLIVGIVLDGCGSGEYSQHGSGLEGEFLIRQILHYHMLNVPVLSIPRLLYSDLVDFIKRIASAFSFEDEAELAMFVSDYLESTCIGFIVATEDYGDSVVFAAGDGIVVINDEFNIRDEKNKPSYPAYHAVSRRYLNITKELPTTFDVYPIATSELRRIAVCTDAWAREPDLVNQIWTSEIVHNGAYPHGLQMQVNIWADEKLDRHFEDDATIAICERREEEDVNTSDSGL